MAFTVEDFHDLVRLLEQQPAWRGELRRLLLSDEILTLPQIVQDLVEAQQRAEERLAGVEERLGRVEQIVEQLAEAQRRTEGRLAELAEAQVRTEEAMKGLVVRVGDLHGTVLEIRYQERAFAFFRSIVLRGHALSAGERSALIEDAVERGLISDAEAGDLVLADVIVRGRFREDGREVYLVVEVSAGIGPGDVRRAADRAAVLAKLGLDAIPVVAGERVVRGTLGVAQAQRVWQVTDGHVLAPPAA